MVYITARLVSCHQSKRRHFCVGPHLLSSEIMSKLIIATLLAIISLTQASVNLQYRTQNPYTIGLGSHLYTISQSPTDIWIDSTDENASPCKISTQINFNGRIKAAALSNKIIVWGEQSEEQINNGETRRTNYVVLLLDPKACSHKVLSDLVDEVPASQVHIPAEVVTHQNSFDIFLPGQSKCSPCRYNVDGGRMTAPGQMKHSGTPRAPFHLREIGKTNTYFYVYNFDNGHAKVWRLDQDYQIIESPTLFASTTIDDFAVGYDGTSSYFGYSKIYPTKSSYLILLDDKLAFNQFIRMPRVANQILYKTLISFDSHGNWHVVVLFRSKLDGSTNVKLVRYTDNGEFIGEYEIGKLEINKNFDVQSILIDNQKDCVVIHELDNGVTDVKCIDMV